MNLTSFDEPAIGESGSAARKIQVYEYYLKEIFAMGGCCILGNAEFGRSPAFQAGSMTAFDQAANLAEKALDSKDF